MQAVAAGRYDRRAVARFCQIIKGLAAFTLAWPASAMQTATIPGRAFGFTDLYQKGGLCRS
jgi:hypothetical protein